LFPRSSRRTPKLRLRALYGNANEGEITTLAFLPGEPLDPERSGLARELARRLRLPSIPSGDWRRTSTISCIYCRPLRADAMPNQYEIRVVCRRHDRHAQALGPISHDAFMESRMGVAGRNLYQDRACCSQEEMELQSGEKVDQRRSERPSSARMAPRAVAAIGNWLGPPPTRDLVCLRLLRERPRRVTGVRHRGATRPRSVGTRRHKDRLSYRLLREDSDPHGAVLWPSTTGKAMGGVDPATGPIPGQREMAGRQAGAAGHIRPNWRGLGLRKALMWHLDGAVAPCCRQQRIILVAIRYYKPFGFRRDTGAPYTSGRLGRGARFLALSWSRPCSAVHGMIGKPRSVKKKAQPWHGEANMVRTIIVDGVLGGVGWVPSRPRKSPGAQNATIRDCRCCFRVV